MGRGELLGGEAVAAAEHLGHGRREVADALVGGFAQGGDHVQVERVADGAGFLAAVQYRDCS
jgi:hypothetical protein